MFERAKQLAPHTPAAKLAGLLGPRTLGQLPTTAGTVARDGKKIRNS